MAPPIKSGKKKSQKSKSKSKTKTKDKQKTIVKTKEDEEEEEAEDEERTMQDDSDYLLKSAAQKTTTAESAEGKKESKHVSIPDIVQRPQVGDTVKKKYLVVKELGEGGFGVVLEVEDQRTREHYAMKVELEQPPEDEPGLELEGAVLRRLQGYGHILRFIDEGKYGEFSFMVMQLAGHNLNDLRKHCPDQRFTNSTTVRLALQCLEAIETVHVGGFLHRDIKPANFAMGFLDKDKKTVYILDFGLVRRFRTKEGKVRPRRPTAAFRGSYQYASINAHKNLDLGRCDDLWSWLYSVIQMKVGKLPWRKVNGKRKVGEFKENTTREELLSEMEPEFYKIFDSLKTLRYADNPPYAFYRDSLTSIVKRKRYSYAAPFDWEEGGEHYDHTVYIKPRPYGEQLANEDKENEPEAKDQKKAAAKKQPVPKK